MVERAHLAIVSALRKHGTLTRAAEELCLSQSALSHTMHKLEEQIGCRLWRKDGRRLHLTEAGEHLLKVSRHVLPLLEDGERVLGDFAAGVRGTLRIGIECHPCYTWLLRSVSRYLASWPEVDVDVTERFQFDGAQALIDRQVDLLITPDPVHNTALRYEPALDYRLMLVAGRKHGLTLSGSAQRRWIAPADLREQDVLTYPVPRERLDVFTRFLSPAGVEPRRHRSVETTEIMLELVAAGRGVTTLPDYLVKQYIETMPIEAIELGEAGIEKTLYIGLRTEDGEIGYLKGFVDGACAGV